MAAVPSQKSAALSLLLEGQTQGALEVSKQARPGPGELHSHWAFAALSRGREARGPLGASILQAHLSVSLF